MNVNLILQKKNGSRKSFHLPSEVTVIGRKQECDLCIPLMIVSRKHCEINYDQHQLKIRDMGSRNGTYVNGDKIEDEILLNPGDAIQIGPLKFVAQINGKPENLETEQVQNAQSFSRYAKEKEISDRAAEFNEESDDMNQTYSQTEMLNSISDENEN